MVCVLVNYFFSICERAYTVVGDKEEQTGFQSGLRVCACDIAGVTTRLGD